METLRLRPRGLDFRSVTVISLFARAMDSLGAWRVRARERRQLSGLSDVMLKDIGVSRADASKEFEKPFWRS